jgi:hypothetical protein
MAWIRPVSLWLILSVLCEPALTQSHRPEKWEGAVRQGTFETFFRMELDSPEHGRLEILGQKLLFEVAVRKGNQIEIRTLETNPTIFRGERHADRIAGDVMDERGPARFWMELEPSLPAPHDRTEAWAQDLSYVSRKLPQLDRSFTLATREKFRDAMIRLQRETRQLDDPHIMVRLAQAVALPANAHTRLYIVRTRTEVRQYPVQVWWFKKELRVLRATPEYESLLGCEVTGIGGHSASAVRARVTPLYAGSRSWADYMSTYTLTSAEILYGLDLIPAMDHAPWTFRCPSGMRSVALDPLSLRKSDRAVESWWSLSPQFADRNQQYVALQLPSLPLYLRHPEKNYWFEYQEDKHLLYFQFNRAVEQADENLRDFGLRLEAALRRDPVRTFVVDLRFNTGGNLDLGRTLMEHLQVAAEGRRVYVITGRATFSAGIFHAAQWKQWGKATFVGEAVGDGLDFWSEGGNLSLPNSGWVVHFANAFHSYSRTEYPERKPYFADLSIDSLAPDYATGPSFEDYQSGRDPAMDLVFSRIAGPTQ